MQSPPLVALQFVVLLLSLTVHEFSHARAAFALGDKTAAALGRMSLSPVPHIDVIGTIVFPLIGLFTNIPIIGWAKPVPINPILFTRRLRMKTGVLIVSVAGPISNLFLAVLGTAIGAALTMLAPQIVAPGSPAALLLMFMIIINTGLAFFNILPIPPLDGSKIIYGVLPDRIGQKFMAIEPYAAIGLLILLFTGALNVLLRPVVYIMMYLLNISGLLTGVSSLFS